MPAWHRDVVHALGDEGVRIGGHRQIGSLVLDDQARPADLGTADGTPLP
jgi:hypothetical protein